MPAGLLGWFVELPLLGSFAIFIGLKLLIPTGRLVFEGHFYDVALSSVIGETSGFIAVLIGFSTLKQERFPLPSWLGNNYLQALIYGACVVLCFVGCVKTIREREGRAMDVYHDLIVAPLIVYFAVDLLLPVIVLHGNAVEILFVASLLALWGLTFWFDSEDGRLRQRPWQRARGTKFSDE